MTYIAVTLYDGQITVKDTARLRGRDAQALFNTIGATDKTMKVFTVEEGGYEHSQGDNHVGNHLHRRLALG
jgi:hypothetical protein